MNYHIGWIRSFGWPPSGGCQIVDLSGGNFVKSSDDHFTVARRGRHHGADQGAIRVGQVCRKKREKKERQRERKTKGKKKDIVKERKKGTR